MKNFRTLQCVVVSNKPIDFGAYILEICKTLSEPLDGSIQSSYLFHISAQFSALCKQSKHQANIALSFTQKCPSHTLQAIICSCPSLPLLWPSLDSIRRTNSPHPAQTTDHRRNPQTVRVRPAVSLWL